MNKILQVWAGVKIHLLFITFIAIAFYVTTSKDYMLWDWFTSLPYLAYLSLLAGFFMNLKSVRYNWYFVRIMIWGGLNLLFGTSIISLKKEIFAHGKEPCCTMYQIMDGEKLAVMSILALSVFMISSVAFWYDLKNMKMVAKAQKTQSK